MGLLTGLRSIFYDEDVNSGASNSQAMIKKIAQGVQFINQKQVTKLEFAALGPYDVASGYPIYTNGAPLEFDYELYNLWATNGVVGSSGTTEFDIEVKPAVGGSWTSILSTTGKFISTSANDDTIDTLGVVASPPTGVTRPVVSNANLSAGYLIRMKLVSGMAGGSSLTITLNMRPR